MNNESKKYVLRTLDRNSAFNELKEIHTELGIALETGTLITDEYIQMDKRMAELMCIVDYLDLLNEEN